MNFSGALIVVSDVWERREAEVEGTVLMVEAVSKGLLAEYVDDALEERRRRGKADLKSVLVEVELVDWWKRR